jgi:hypothetical protein
VLRIFPQRELFVSAGAYLVWQASIVVPEIRVRPMDHGTLTLKQSCSSGLMVGQCVIDAIVDAACLKVVRKLLIDRLWVRLIKPQIEFFSLLRRESV